VPGIGQIAVDVAFGGAFYAILPAALLGLKVAPDQTARLTAAGIEIKRTVSESLTIRHPEEPDLAFLYGTILTGPPVESSHHSQNVCIFADGEVDRSPTGTGVCARLAQLCARGEIAVGEWIVVESILGSLSAFRGRVADDARVGSYAAVVPEVSGSAHITGRHTFVVDPRDDLGRGFLVDGGPHAAIPPI
jgi:trans-L-3-hydroxyproline dehydratase